MVHFTESGGDSELSRQPGVAPVIPLFGRDAPSAPARSSAVAFREADDEDDVPGREVGIDECTVIEREIAERSLTKRLRTRQLSVAEARDVVRERNLEPEDVEAVIERFLHLGYLDDAALADQLVRAGVERKGQGRQAIALALAKRGVPRDVADVALATLPDDDAERALEFARSKARSMTSLDRDAAVRRLSGQLARRGYPGQVALTAARAALDELGTSASGVRFR